MDVVIDDLHLDLGDIVLPEPVTVTGVVTDLDGLPSPIPPSVQGRQLCQHCTHHHNRMNRDGSRLKFHLF